MRSKTEFSVLLKCTFTPTSVDLSFGGNRWLLLFIVHVVNGWYDFRFLYLCVIICDLPSTNAPRPRGGRLIVRFLSHRYYSTQSLLVVSKVSSVCANRFCFLLRSRWCHLRHSSGCEFDCQFDFGVALQASSSASLLTYFSQHTSRIRISLLSTRLCWRRRHGPPSSMLWRHRWRYRICSTWQPFDKQSSAEVYDTYFRSK